MGADTRNPIYPVGQQRSAILPPGEGFCQRRTRFATGFLWTADRRGQHACRFFFVIELWVGWPKGGLFVFGDLRIRKGARRKPHVGLHDGGSIGIHEEMRKSLHEEVESTQVLVGVKKNRPR